MKILKELLYITRVNEKKKKNKENLLSMLCLSKIYLDSHVIICNHIIKFI